MRFRANYQTSLVSRALLAAALSLLAVGCHSTANSSGNSTSSGGESTTEAGGRIDLNCLGNHIENPPEAFHYSFRSTAGGLVVKEAEITPQSMDIMIQNQFGSHKYHGVRSDEASWNSAVLNLTGNGLTGMSARIEAIKGKAAVVPAGTEPMNGYQTTKYSIDTTKANSSEMRTYEAFFGSGSYDRGTIWVTADGCPVKLSLDEATKQANGALDQTHYDIAMIKK